MLLSKNIIKNMLYHTTWIYDLALMVVLRVYVLDFVGHKMPSVTKSGMSLKWLPKLLPKPLAKPAVVAVAAEAAEAIIVINRTS